MINTVVGEPNLLPEKITTYEAQVSYFRNQGNIAVTYFRSKAKDKISRVLNPDSNIDQIYANVGELSSSGVELEGKYYFSSNSYFLGSYTFYTNENEDGEENVTRIPAHSLKLGISYRTDQLGFGLFNSLYSSPFQTVGAREGLGDLAAFNWMTLKVDWSASNSFQSSGDYGLSIEAVNLLDEKVYEPELFLGTFNSVNIRPGIGLYANVYYQF